LFLRLPKAIDKAAGVSKWFLPQEFILDIAEEAGNPMKHWETGTISLSEEELSETW
jgi:hypothetical protein